MRVHIELDEKLVEELDSLAGPRDRSAFVRLATERAIEQKRRWQALTSAGGSIATEGHDWDADPAEWVRTQRHGDTRRAV